MIIKSQDKANARAADRKWQFEGYDSDGEQVSMMLNTDFEVFYELDLDDDSQAQCDVQSDALTCQKSETYDIAAQYAEVRFSHNSSNACLKRHQANTLRH